MREITEHMVNECNEQIAVRVIDEPGAGGANHRYEIEVAGRTTCLGFQDGPVKESGVNGLTHEALLAVVIDRLQSFQRGAYACRENALALTKLEEAQMWLHSRTRRRIARGVEGTHEK